MEESAVELLTNRPRIFWGRVIRILIERGWKPPPPDEKIVDDLLHAFERLKSNLDITPAGQDSEYGLTPRQLQILQLAANGCTNDEIAEILGIAHQTVKFHMAEIFTRMDAYNRAHAVALGFRGGLLT